MIRFATGFVLGVVLAAWAPIALKLGALAALPALPGRRRLVPLLAVLLGLVRFEVALDSHRGDAVQAPARLTFAGVVHGLVDHGARGARFTVITDRGGRAGRRFRLFWPDAPATLLGGDRIVVRASVRPPRGLANPGGFDLEQWAFSERVTGMGFVETGHRAPGGDSLRARIDRRRGLIARDLRATLGDGPAGRLLPALAVGDRAGLTAEDRALLQATGTLHLLAISGLHIGLVAAGGLGAGRFLWPIFGRRWTRRGFGLAFALPLAAAYTALAGLSVSAVRAFLMFTVLAVTWWSRGRIRPASGLLLAAAVLLLARPESVAGAGFWLSFVAAILVALVGQAAGRSVFAILRLQLAVCLLQRPVLGAFGLPMSASAPIVNIPAIPWVGWAIVPPLLLSIALAPFAPPLAAALLVVASWALDGFHRALVWVGAWAGQPLPVVADAGAMVLLLAGAAAILLPRTVGVRAAGLALVLLSLVPRTSQTPDGALDLHVLDVGQGLAALVEVEGRWLLYDAGPRSRSGWSAGAAVVLPFLDRSGVGSLDAAVISHGDADHAGGWSDVAGRLPGRPWTSAAELGRPCAVGNGWRWGEARFEFLHPTVGLPYLGNDSSCVLLIEYRGSRVLLPGDVSSAVEARLIEQLGPIDVLVAGHHGSASSSSPAFLAATRPALTIFAHGYGNRFGMPRPDVLERFAGRRVLSTAACGHLHLRVHGGAVELLQAERQQRRRRWHPTAQDDGHENQYDCAPQR